MSRRTRRHDASRVAIDDRPDLTSDDPTSEGTSVDAAAVDEGAVDEGPAEPDAEPEPEPLESFWGADSLSTEENAEALAQLLDGGHDAAAAARTTRSYMGIAAGEDEREQLARWAEGQACQGCRRQRSTGHDLARLKHDDCRNALRTAQLLTRDA